MTSQTTPDIVLYDLACSKDVCFSPAVWRVRLTLNYKQIPYRTVFVEFPDIQEKLKEFGIPASSSSPAYTVPAIYHAPTNTYMMDSYAIVAWLEKQYPDPPLTLTSDLGKEVEAKGRAAFANAYRTSLMSREPAVLPPRSAEYFRRTREATLNHTLEELLADGKEEKVWAELEPKMREVGELLKSNGGPFVLGKQPSLTDFFVAGSLQTGRVVHEPVFERIMGLPGFKEVYDACSPWMERKD